MYVYVINVGEVQDIMTEHTACNSWVYCYLETWTYGISCDIYHEVSLSLVMWSSRDFFFTLPPFTCSSLPYTQPPWAAWLHFPLGPLYTLYLRQQPFLSSLQSLCLPASLSFTPYLPWTSSSPMLSSPTCPFKYAPMTTLSSTGTPSTTLSSLLQNSNLWCVSAV